MQKSLKDVSAVKPQIVGKQSTKLGRPTVKPDPVIVEKVLEHVANGGTLRAFCRKKGMPSYRTLYRWMSQNNEESKDFLSRFTYTSRFLGARAIAEECLEIIDTLPTVIGEGENARYDNAIVNYNKARADVRLRLLAKWFPQEYSEKLIGIETKGDINVTVITGVPEK